MPLCKRVIPTILVRGKTAYKGPGFGSECTRSIGSALAIAQVHARRGVDELCILDISATAEGRGPDLDLIRELTQTIFTPVTVGGGVRSIDDINALLRAGADKVCIGSAITDPRFIKAASEKFGRQAIVVSLDIIGENTWTHSGNGVWGLSINKIRQGPAQVAAYLEKQGAGEILLQSIKRDGMMQGYDLDLIREVSAAVNIPVIASGGCGTPQHMLEAFEAGADACAAGAMFAFTDETPKSCAKFLKQHGKEVRV